MSAIRVKEAKCEDPKPRKRLPSEPPKATKERAALRAFENLGMSLFRCRDPIKDFVIQVLGQEV